MFKVSECLLAKYAKQYSKHNSRQEVAEVWYGTAGFRMKATDLPYIVFRMGLFASVRSQFCRAAIGLMLTASHNPISDNGIKLIDPDGEMLDAACEAHISRLANCDDEDLLATIYDLIVIVKESWRLATIPQTDDGFSDYQPVLILGRDTRPSCAVLCDAAIAGASCFNARTVDFGLVTTPMLHFIVRCSNDLQRASVGELKSTNGDQEFPLSTALEQFANNRSTGRIEDAKQPNMADDILEALRYGTIYGEPSLDGYYRKLARNFTKLLRLFGVKENKRADVTVDCANGVGYLHLRALSERIPSSLLRVKLINTGDGELNFGCGADFVKLECRFPSNVNKQKNDFERFVAFDGDADRIVYFYAEPVTGSCKLLDGDKLAYLLAVFVVRLLRDARIPLGSKDRENVDSSTNNEKFQVHFGVVQTAYANGSSTQAINELGREIDTCCVPTGIKFLIAKAAEYDVGVFFESNGHGTVLFSERLKCHLRNLLQQQYSVEVDRLLTFINIINETVGDSLSDLLLIEAILAIDSIRIDEWDAMYTDLPSRQLKVAVPDRLRIRTTYDERRVVAPASLQDAIDRLVDAARNGTLCNDAADKCARSFVRPSGTENVVRVYAEAVLQSTADILALRVADVLRAALVAN